MDQAAETLPIRLKPRRWSQVFFLLFFGFFLCFAIFWMIGSSQPGVKLHFNDVEVTDPYWRSLFPLWGIPFALIGLCGFVVAAMKMLPSSPYYYLELTSNGVTLATLFKKQSLAWRDLPALTLKEESDSESGPYYHVVAIVDETSAEPRELLRIPVGQYGTANTKKGALELTAWINQIRDLAMQGRLDAKTKIRTPDGLVSHIVASVPAERTIIRTK